MLNLIFNLFGYQINKIKKHDSIEDSKGREEDTPGAEGQRWSDLVKPESHQIHPVYYAYKGGFDRVTICLRCGSTGLYWDQNTVNPCASCGGKVSETDPKRWVYDRTLTTNGYWTANDKEAEQDRWQVDKARLLRI